MQLGAAHGGFHLRDDVLEQVVRFRAMSSFGVVGAVADDVCPAGTTVVWPLRGGSVLDDFFDGAVFHLRRAKERHIPPIVGARRFHLRGEQAALAQVVVRHLHHGLQVMLVEVFVHGE